MTTYIAEFSCTHKVIQIEQHSCFTWQQEGGEVDEELLQNKILRESSIHFFRLVIDSDYPIALEDLQLKIIKTQPFKG